jgi:hypothetical protein
VSIRTARNIAIIVVIAAAVAFLPGGGRTAHTFEAALLAVFAAGFGFLGLRIYRERRISIYGLGDRHRALLYGAIALAVFAWAARARMWESSLGEVVWFAIVGFIAYAAMEVYRYSRTY